jgi:hypothetical protein
MTLRPGFTRFLPPVFAVLISLVGACAMAGPIVYNVSVDTSPPGVPAGTQGSLEFQFASAAGLPPGSATISDFLGGMVVGLPTAFSGNVSGTLSPGPLTISETATNNADTLQDFNFSNSVTFEVTLPDPGTFSLTLWDQRGGAGNQLLSIPASVDPSANGAALVITVDPNGIPSAEAGPGVSPNLVPEPSSVALVGLAVATLAGCRVRRRCQER